MLSKRLSRNKKEGVVKHLKMNQKTK